MKNAIYGLERTTTLAVVAAVLIASGVAGFRLGKMQGGNTPGNEAPVLASQSGRPTSSDTSPHGSLKAFSQQVNLADLETARDEIATRLDHYGMDEMVSYLRDNAARLVQSDWRKEFVARAIAEYFGEADPGAALAMAEQIHNDAVQSALVTGALRRMARDDPDAAMTRAAAAPINKGAAITGVVDSLSQTHPARAVAFLNKHRTDVDEPTKHFTHIFKNWISASRQDAEAYAAKHHFHEPFVAALAETDVDGALDWAIHEMETRADLSLKPGMLITILDVYANREPAKAAERLNQLLRYHPEIHSADIASQFFASDPAAAMEWARRIPHANLRRHICQQIHHFTVCSDPSQAGVFAATLPPDAQKHILSGLHYTLGWADMPQLLARYDALGIDYSESDSVSYEVYQWSETDPVAALGFFAKNYDPVKDPHPFVEAIEELAQDDPEAAASHAEVLQDEGRMSALTAVVEEWVYSDAAVAATFVGNLENADERVKMAGVLVDKCREQDRATVADWAKNLSGPEGERARLVLDLTSWRAPGTDMADAIPRVNAAYLSMPEPERMAWRRQFSSIWAQWASIAPEAAAAQAISWEESLTRRTRWGHPLVSTLHAWYKADRPSALAWVRAIPEEPKRNDALIALALSYDSGSYRSSSHQKARLFMEISDSEARARGLEMLGGWEADQAREYIEKEEGSQ